MDQPLKLEMETRDGAESESAERYDSCGALDLSSSCSSSVQGEDTREEAAEETRKRKADREGEVEGPVPLKVRNKRRNIKTVLEDDQLKGATQAARAEEQQRLTRLVEKQKQLLMEVSTGAAD